MSFQFKQKESVDEAVRRVFRECVGEARGMLSRCGRPAAVHNVRKQIKKLRAILRLVRSEIGRDDYDKSVKPLRQVADGLTESRDAHTRLTAFLKLVGRAAQFVDVEDNLRRHCQRESRRFRKNQFVAKAGRRLWKTGRRMDSLKIRATDAWIEPGLEQNYGLGRTALSLVRKNPSSENFHEWRKHVKDLWYCLLLLHLGLPVHTRAMTGRLESLSESLGDDHDLVLLREFVVEKCDRRRSGVKILLELIESRQAELRAEALKLGVRIYAETPEVFCRRVGADWSRWHRNKKGAPTTRSA
jgi:CHAD domain-containing protein